MQLITEFYAGKEVFMTGGTGFMGKVLIEKLLRSCPDVKMIHLLVRGRKDKTPAQRVEILKENPLFDRIKIENPTALSKLNAIEGDVMEIGLGLSPESLKILENVEIIFHVAASVRFDDPLKDAILMNARGTRELLLFGETLRNLKICVHVSTTYCNPDRKCIEETLYPAPADWRASIKIAETLDKNILDIYTQKFLKSHPNTYTFAKALAEQIVNDFRHRLPVVIFRPSIVVSTIDEPFPGWIDNFNGPIGLLVACGIGIMRTTFGNPNQISDYTPCDIAIRAMLVVAWKHGIAFEKTKISEKTFDVYNCSTSKHRYLTMGEMVEMGRELSMEYPFDKLVWTPGGQITNSRILNYIKVLLFHILPAFLLDTCLKFSGRKQFLTKLQRRIYSANMALEFFILNQWEFKNDKFMSLNSELMAEERSTFAFDTFVTRDVRMYFTESMLGARRFLLKEKDEDLPKARVNSKRMYYLDKVVKMIFFGAILYYFIMRFGIRVFVV